MKNRPLESCFETFARNITTRACHGTRESYKRHVRDKNIIHTNTSTSSAAFLQRFQSQRILTMSLLVLMFGMLTACATTSPSTARHPQDPWEPFNRKVFAFNETVDTYILKPTAQAYQKGTPKLVQKGIGNFFSNLGTIPTIVNEILQLKLVAAASDSARFVLNSTVGLLGFIDVASMIGMEKNREDFGQTLGHWGVPSGPYLVLPFFASSTLRDASGMVVDNQYDDGYDILQRHVQLPRGDARYAVTGLKVVDLRAGLLEQEKLISGDRYTFIRDAYLQRRTFLVDDGAIREDAFVDENADFDGEEIPELVFPD